MSHLIAPSLLAADFSRLEKEMEMVNNSAADWLHLDVMDGRFVPNISFGFPILQSIKKKKKKPFDVHLMIVEPEKYVHQFAEAGADIITVHLEACPHLHRNIEMIQALGVKAGVALNPHSPVSSLSEVIGMVDLVCLMSVNPGFGGQTFIRSTVSKVRQLKELITSSRSNALIEIDGGVSLENAGELVEAGADVLVAGSTIFKSDNPLKTCRELKNINAKERIA